MGDLVEGSSAGDQFVDFQFPLTESQEISLSVLSANRGLEDVRGDKFADVNIALKDAMDGCENGGGGGVCHDIAACTGVEDLPGEDHFIVD